ncbi:MAG: winged helix-turn-helix domain-containing protein [Sphingomonas sp.]
MDLAHEADFRLGRIAVSPALRQLVRDDGAEEIVEPRVMQVLVALAQAKGAIVGRDALTQRCWDGRVVGEDAINRVISRLRRSAEGIGEGAFRIETVTKVGYRLVAVDVSSGPSPPSTEAAAAIAEARKLRVDRRAMLIGGGAAVVAAGGYAAVRRWTAAPAAAPSPQVAAMVAQAVNAMKQGTPDSASQAMGLLKRVTEIAPDYADGWGLLATVYAAASWGGAPQAEAAMRSRADQAIARALQLDPGNGNARAARASMRPIIGNWLSREKELRALVADHDDNHLAWGLLSGLLLGVGRCREAADMVVRGWQRGTPDPALAYARIVTLWAANRLDEADAAANEAGALYPTHFAVWFTRFYLLLYTGRADQALAMGDNADSRPSGIPDWNFDLIFLVARAMVSRARADIDKALAANLDASHRGAGFAQNTIQFAAALGRVDLAFAVAGAYFFARGFEIGPLDWSKEQRIYSRSTDRRTYSLFLPSTAAMRTDPRFDALVGELGISQYWRESGVQPDYKRFA